MKIDLKAGLSGVRLDSFISQNSDLTRSHVKKAIEEGCVTVNGKVQKSSYVVRENDCISVCTADPKPLDAHPVDIPVDIIYQDDDLAVINKQQGLTVHAGNGTDDNTLVNALLYSLDKLSGINGVLRPGIVHRIDKDTSGLLVVAKNDKAHLSLSEQIAEKTCKRQYLALLHGEMKNDEGTLDTFIDRSKKDRTTYTVTAAQGRRAITLYKVKERFEGYTLCEFTLKTGRTHQIRVHSKHIGHPVVGDRTYGPKKCPFELNGQLLHAYRLTFVHPSTGKEMTFEAPLPDYFLRVLGKLKRK